MRWFIAGAKDNNEGINLRFDILNGQPLDERMTFVASFLSEEITNKNKVVLQHA
ncbi:hypothetical protein C942_04891 [Photobacterium marinum]|uniref:Uncharacterized protein n=1 Tax=Photobacterium marinum TaxID=1056511 RepID=L8J2H3_9GAMM|nr:hypothetical protein [Photobacterium marinum]ELR63065.1 hypothetical protein C942_04891 [Photobacterium marinum]